MNRQDDCDPKASSPSTVVEMGRGRQLFLDDHIIAHTDMVRTFHRPALHPASPVLFPSTALEQNGGQVPVSCPYEDGVFYDPQDQMFKMWYHAGWTDGTAYATSEDGIRWRRPTLDVVADTNRVLPQRPRHVRDNVTVWLDHEANDPAQRYKMLSGFRPLGYAARSEVRTSPDGIHWSAPTIAGPCGDNTTFYRDPFRSVWVFSIRSYRNMVRVRSYAEARDFVGGAVALDGKGERFYKPEDPNPWLEASHSAAEGATGPSPAELYKFSAVAYENLLVGLFAVFHGPSNEVSLATGEPKIIDLSLGWSRDGMTWTRAPDGPFLACSRRKGDWNRAYLHSAGGLFLVVRDALHFYFGAWSGRSPALGDHMVAGGCTGLATLRRDGFSSMDAGPQGGTLETRPFLVRGRHLFVNADASRGSLAVEILDRWGRPLRPFPSDLSRTMTSNSTCSAVHWPGVEDLARLRGAVVRLRFHLREAQLYSFWLADDERGRSGGYVAAGGPGLPGAVDS